MWTKFLEFRWREFQNELYDDDDGVDMSVLNFFFYLTSPHPSHFSSLLSTASTQKWWKLRSLYQSHPCYVLLHNACIMLANFVIDLSYYVMLMLSSSFFCSIPRIFTLLVLGVFCRCELLFYIISCPWIFAEEMYWSNIYVIHKLQDLTFVHSETLVLFCIFTAVSNAKPISTSTWMIHY